MELSWWEVPLFREPGWRPSASPVPYFQGALVFMTLVFLFETYLDLRQHRKLHDKQFPKPLAEAIEGLGSYSVKKKEKNEEEKEDEKEKDGEDETQQKEEEEEETTLLEATRTKFDKSRAYGLDKSTFGFVSGGYNQLEATVFLLLGYLPFAWTMSGKALLALGLDADNEIYRALMLLTLTTLRDTLVGIPFGLYSTFVVEARHGFNKQTLGLFFMDKIKSFMLFVVIGFPSRRP